MKKHIAFVTCSTKPDFAANDLPVATLLRGAGHDVVAMPWDVSASWANFDLVVIRSAWNYHHHAEKFTHWIDHLEQEKVKLFNPAKVLRWNLHKSYLQELQSQGITMPKTVWLDKGSKAELTSVIAEQGWRRAVVKPAISATAFNTFLITARDGSRQTEFESLLAQGDMLIQQFVEEVQRDGEWSLLYFNKKFSHAVIKRPAARDFRVQNDFGGSAEVAHPPLFVLKQAEKILTLIDSPLLYARVDGVVSGDQFLLMELELLEPMLFLDDATARTFANAILSYTHAIPLAAKLFIHGPSVV